MKSNDPKYSEIKDKNGIEIEVGDTIKDGFGNIGKVVKNMHPWGFERLQYNGLSIIQHPNKRWYEIIKKHEN